MRILLSLLLIGGILGPACSQVHTIPSQVQPQNYTQITFKELVDQPAALLAKTKLVKVQGYYWQRLEYAPTMVRFYLSVVRHPLGWTRLKWFAIYDSPDMRGYFDRLAMSSKQGREYKLKRLDPVMVYGEFVPMGGGAYYLRVHKIEKIEID